LAGFVRERVISSSSNGGMIRCVGMTRSESLNTKSPHQFDIRFRANVVDCDWPRFSAACPNEGHRLLRISVAADERACGFQPGNDTGVLARHAMFKRRAITRPRSGGVDVS